MNEHCKKIFSLISKNLNDELIIDHESIRNLALKFNLNLSDEEIKELLEAGDFDQDNKINQEDFIKILKNTNFINKDN
jgi:Ca2+-binding EF-hand superfamily protein